jgi:hypothetical protein
MSSASCRGCFCSRALSSTCFTEAIGTDMGGTVSPKPMMRSMRMCPTMGMMSEGMPGGVMGGGMLQMRGEMLKAIGDVIK